jgi:predicted phosphodiesterase
MAYRVGVIGDLHIPVHDERAVNLVLDIFEDIGIDELVLNGDILDVYLLNSHGPKHPDFQGTLEWEFEKGNEFLDLLQKKLPKTKIYFNAGNHEFRLDRFVINNAPHFWNILTVEKMLRLKERGIPYLPYNEEFRLGETQLYTQHSPPSYGENGARTSLLKKPGRSWIFGCTHRMQSAYLNHGDGIVHSAHFNGWLGSIDETPSHRAVFQYIKGHNSWQQCFILATIDGPNHFVSQYEIKNYCAVVDGHIYQG